MGEDDIEYTAWSILLNGAESSLEGWLWIDDEEGRYTDADRDKIYEMAWGFLTRLKIKGLESLS